MRAGIDQLQQAADFIIKYGFLAVGLVLVFLVVPTVHKLLKSSRVTVGTTCFGIAFIVAAGIVSLLERTAPWLISQRTILTGVILGVNEGYEVQMRSDIPRIGQAYTKREYDSEKKNIYNFPFILLTPDVPGCLAVAFASTNKSSGGIFVFNVSPISREDMTADVDIVVQVVRKQDSIELQVWRERNFHRVGSPVTLAPLPADQNDCGSAATQHASRLGIISQALAQPAQGTSLADLRARLMSDDVFTRRDARIELARQPDALAKIAQLLDSDDARLLLEATTTLVGMRDQQLSRMPADLRLRLHELLNHPDRAVRDAALRSLREPAFCYQEKDENKSAAQRFLVLCQWSRQECETVRGPNNSPGVTQSECTRIDLSSISWNYRPGGSMGSWYQYSPTPLGGPFPKVP